MIKNKAGQDKKEDQKKSKNLHKPPLILAIFRFVFKRLGPIAPSLIGRWAYRLWFKTHRIDIIPAREISWFNDTNPSIESIEISCDEIDINPLPVATYYWENTPGDNAPLVMLVHGWTGRGSQMAGFAEPLLKAGFRVLAFDNHAHALTPGKSSTIFKQSAVQRALVEKFGPVYAIVAHSFGGMVTPYSLSHGMDTQKVVCISAPSHFDYLLLRFSNTLYLPESIQQYMIKRFKKEYGDDLIERVSGTHTAKTLGHIPALLIHDEDDEDVPISESEQLQQAWPNSSFKSTSGLGHRRILYNPQVIEMVVNFLK
ncbi:MAG: alpha/beta hydrolase [Gammaproteobacteria bacterium]|nr:alpha/beta hydrolase [Gammaproteobacteria bacterium]